MRLVVDGSAYGGFQRGSFTRTMEDLVGSFELSYSAVWEQNARAEPIVEGSRCRVAVDGETLVDGWVDEASPGYDVARRSFAVSGRSVTCDLVDCAFVPSAHASGQFSDQKLGRVLTSLVRPFGAVQLIVLGDEGAKLGKFAVQRGERVGDAIVRAARLRGMVAYSVGDQLVVSRVGVQRTATRIVRGQNVIDASRTASVAERFSEYRFKGQTRANDDTNGTPASEIHGVVRDLGVSRYRPTVVVAGGTEGPRDAGLRAILERNQRAGRSERLRYTVEGWRTAEGTLWEPNLRVEVDDDWLGVTGEWVVANCKCSFDGSTGQGGYVTSLELARPEAFDVGEYPLTHRRR